MQSEKITHYPFAVKEEESGNRITGKRDETGAVRKNDGLKRVFDPGLYGAWHANLYAARTVYDVGRICQIFSGYE